MTRADDRANIRQASTGGPDFTVKDWPDPTSVAAEEALSKMAAVLARRTTSSIPSWAATIHDIEASGYRIVPVEAARSRPAGELDVERLIEAAWRTGILTGAKRQGESAVRELAAEYARLASSTTTEAGEGLDRLAAMTWDDPKVAEGVRFAVDYLRAAVRPDAARSRPAGELDGDTLRRAIADACSLTNPRLSEVEWDDVADRLASSTTTEADR